MAGSPVVYERLFTPPKGSFFLLGVRGVGKSTLARHLFPDATRIDLLQERLFQTYLTDPDAFAMRLAAEPPGALVVVDEIQRLPNLLNEIHRAIEERRLRFALLGSSARKLKTAGTNLLAGRAVRRELFPMTPHEMGTTFDLARALRIGSLPLVLAAEEPEATLEAYVDLYLKEEVRAEALVRNLPAFSRFLSVAALFHGGVLNTTNVAREAAVSRTTVQGYLEILESTLLATRLPAFEPKLRVRERASPKLFWVDPGIVRAAARLRQTPAPAEIGHLLEGYVFTLLRTYQAYRGLYDGIYYWAAHEGSSLEVDFVLQRGSRLVAIEVKSTSRFSDGWCKGLRLFRSLPGCDRSLVVYLGKERLRTRDGIDVLPVQDFASMLHEGQI
jgi:predicted AAA+ superfamily ATPase